MAQIRITIEDLSGHHDSCAQHIDHVLRCTCERERDWDARHEYQGNDDAWQQHIESPTEER